jgi:hypothetical protein
VQNDRFLFFLVVQQRSEGSDFLMFFEKKKRRFFATLRMTYNVALSLMLISQLLVLILRL